MIRIGNWKTGSYLAVPNYINDGKIIRIIKRYPDGRGVPVRTAFTDVEIAWAKDAVSWCLRTQHGWADADFAGIELYEDSRPQESKSPEESHILVFKAGHTERPAPEKRSLFM